MWNQDKKKKKAGGTTGIEQVVDQNINKLVAARPTMDSARQSSVPKSVTGSTDIPPVAKKPPAMTFSPGDYEDDSNEFQFQAPPTTTYTAEDQKMASSSQYSSTTMAKMPAVPSAPGAANDDYEQRIQRKMAAASSKPPASKSPPDYYTSDSFKDRKMAPGDKFREELEYTRSHYGEVPKENSFLSRPHRFEQMEKKNETNTGTKIPGVQWSARPNNGPTAEVEAVQTAMEEGPPREKEPPPKNYLMWGAIAGSVVALIVVIIVLAVALTRDDSSDPIIVEAGTQEEEKTPSQEFVLSLLPEETQAVVLDNANSPQGQAYRWLAGNPNFFEMNYSNETLLQRYAMATFYFATSGTAWVNNSLWLDHTVHECAWFSAMDEGLAPCDNDANFELSTTQHYELKHLSLQSNGLDGTIPPEISWLSSLETLDLTGNNLRGKIPPELGKLTALTEIDLSANALTGTIPATLGNLGNLTELYLESNELVGNVPAALGNAPLLYLRLQGNSMRGILPPEICDVRSLSIDCDRTFCGCDCSCTNS